MNPHRIRLLATAVVAVAVLVAVVGGEIRPSAATAPRPSPTPTSTVSKVLPFRSYEGDERFHLVGRLEETILTYETAPIYIQVVVEKTTIPTLRVGQRQKILLQDPRSRPLEKGVSLDLTCWAYERPRRDRINGTVEGIRPVLEYCMNKPWSLPTPGPPRITSTPPRPQVGTGFPRDR